MSLMMGFYSFVRFPIDIYRDTYKVSPEMYREVVQPLLKAQNVWPSPITVDSSLHGIEMRHERRR